MTETLGIQIQERDDARRGAIYFLAKTGVESNPTFNLGLTGKFISPTGVVDDLKNGAEFLLRQAGHTGEVIVDGIETVIDKIKEVVASFFNHYLEKAKEVFGEALVGIEWLSEFAAWGVSSFAGTLASLVPGWGYVTSALALYDGIRASVANAIKFIDQLWSGMGVKLLEGSPTIIAEALARHSGIGILSGLKGIARSAAGIGIQAAGDAAAGVGTIITAVTGVLERIANLIGYCIQRFRVRSVLSKAASAWEQRDSDNELLDNHKAFSHWFKSSVVCTPIIAALVLNSGFVAHPYRFLALLYPNDKVASQDEFDKGVRYIEKLKSISRDYARNYLEEYKLVFVGHDDVVTARLNELTG